MFHSWLDSFPVHIELCAVQFPGRANRLREPPMTRLTPLVQCLEQALLPYFDKPFAFFGHSLGALVSFELACALRSRHAELMPVHLFVSGRYAPQLPCRHTPIHELPEVEFIEAVSRFNGTPREVLQSADLMRLLVPVLRADFAVNETYRYRPEPLLDCPISAFGGLQDPVITREDLEAWREQTHCQFTLRLFPGNHFFLEEARTMLLQAMLHDLIRFLNEPAVL